MEEYIEYLPSFYNVSDVVINVQEAFNLEGFELKVATQDLFKQFFIDTATWGLSNWEKYLGIPVNTLKSDADRRTVIKGRLRGSGTTTKNMIKNIAESFSNGTVDVIEDNINYKFTIKFTGVVGIPSNMEDFKNTIENVKPAHLQVEYKFKYITVKDLVNKGWTVAQLAANKTVATLLNEAL